VAKVVRLQAEASIDEISELNECLREVTDHLLLELSGRQHPSESETLRFALIALQHLQTRVVVLDAEGFPRYTNRESGIVFTDPFEWQVAATDQDALREAMSGALSQNQSSKISLRFSAVPEEGWDVLVRPIEVEEEQFVMLELVPETRRT